MFEIIKEHLIPQAEEKQNRIIIEAAPHVTASADYDRLTQILMNITKNSIQFTEKGTVWLRAREEEEETILEVEDTGEGIDPEKIKTIWRRFYKADISRANLTFGEFGLGLSIVKRLVELHEGTIEVKSEKEKERFLSCAFLNKSAAGRGEISCCFFMKSFFVPSYSVHSFIHNSRLCCKRR